MLYPLSYRREFLLWIDPQTLVGVAEQGSESAGFGTFSPSSEPSMKSTASVAADDIVGNINSFGYHLDATGITARAKALYLDVARYFAAYIARQGMPADVAHSAAITPPYV